jgi:hypothetical protein
MVKQFRSWLAIAVLAAASAACNRGSYKEEAVRQAVIDYLSKRSNLNLSAMNVHVDSVTFRENDADAVVSFSARGATPGTPMSVHYTLVRQGDRWTVKNRAEGPGGMPHQGAAAPGGQLPAGHPIVESPKAKP